MANTAQGQPQGQRTAGIRECLERFGEAWDRGDVDALMSMMTDDCVYEASVGSEPGTTYVGREAVRKGFEAFIVHDSGARSGSIFMLANDRAVTEFSYSHTCLSGEGIEIRGVDLWEFAGDKIRRKRAYRKAFGEVEE